MMEKVTSFVAECEALYGLRIVYHDSISMNTFKRLLKSLYRVKADEGIEFVDSLIDSVRIRKDSDKNL